MRPPVLEFHGKQLWAADQLSSLSGGQANTPTAAYYAAHGVDMVDPDDLRNLGEREPVAADSSPTGHFKSSNARWPSAGQSIDQQRQLTWEYRDLEVHGGSFDNDAANDLGKEGWELVSSFTPTNRDSVNVLVFKRRK
jgi:hypothetical protein